LICLQDLAQARARWGEVADGFFSLFNSKIIFPGIGDHRTLALISALAGEVKVAVESYNRPDALVNLLSGGKAVGSTTTSLTWRPRLPVDEISRGYPGYALCLAGSNLSWVRTMPWWQHSVWPTVARMTTPRFSELIRPGADRVIPGSAPVT
jgi:type IV secretion system protein VirD4